MLELTQVIPNVTLLLTLEPEELGAKLLFLLRKRDFQRGMFPPTTLTAEIWPSISLPGRQPIYPTSSREAVDIALTEAWAWLEAQGLIVRAPDSNGDRGWKILSRRARRFESEAEFARYALARMLPKEARKIAETVWMALMRGDSDYAVFQSMKGGEVAVHDASGFGLEIVGTKLMRQAFSPKDGPLTDFEADGGEQIARMELFAGAIGSHKNSQSHRDVDLNDPVEAVKLFF